MSFARAFVLHPVDTLFFRDGSPFNQDDAGLAEARSLFPPPPSVAAGAVRAAMARAIGWVDSDGDWACPAHPRFARLGNRRHLGALRFRGPFVAELGDGGRFRRFWYPAPVALLGRPLSPAETAWSPDGRRRFADLQRLQPAPAVRLRTDGGGGAPVWLPEAPRAVAEAQQRDIKSLSGHWIGGEVLTDLLNVDYAEPYDANLIEPHLTHAEARIGLRRMPEHHRAEDGMLYAATRQRLRQGFALVMHVCDCEPHSPWATAAFASVTPLGGDGGAAYLDELSAADWQNADSLLGAHLPPVDAGDGYLYYTVVLLTPAFADCGKTGRLFAALPGECVFAAHERLVRIGGWAGGPQPTRAALPAGSTLFCRAKADAWSVETLQQKLENLRARGLGKDCDTAFGFGAFAHGAWRPGR